MTRSAFKAAFSDFRLIKGRKVAQLIFELPIEAADAALDTLGGVPRPDKETWCGIARINLGVAQQVEPRTVNAPVTGSNPVSQAKERRPFSSLPLSQQAALRCNDKDFWRFINQECGVKEGIDSSDGAASFVRVHCKVQSRAEITHGSYAGNDWMNLNDRFQAWLGSPF